MPEARMMPEDPVTAAGYRFPPPSSLNFNSLLPLPSGRRVRLGLASSARVPRVNALLNLTGAAVRFATPAGTLELAPAPVPLALVYDAPVRLASTSAFVEQPLGPRCDADGAPLPASAPPETPDERAERMLAHPPEVRTANMQVYAPRAATGFARPLPALSRDANRPLAVLVTAEVAAAVAALGTPYQEEGSALLLGGEGEGGGSGDEDEEEEEEETKEHLKRPRPASPEAPEAPLVAMYGGNERDRLATGEYTSLVHFGRKL